MHHRSDDASAPQAEVGSQAADGPEPASGNSNLRRVIVDAAGGGNLDYLAEQYEQYLADPTSVDESWQAFFAGFALGSDNAVAPSGASASTNGELPAHHQRPDGVPATTLGHAVETGSDSAIGVYDLVHTYREFGHFEAHLDPLEGELDKQRNPHPMLALENFGLDKLDMNAQVGRGGFLGETDGTLGDLLDKLRKTYCRTVGVEFTSIGDRRQRQWLQEQMEPVLNRPKFSSSQKIHLLRQFMAAEEFEQFLQRVFVGAKRFSVEGGEGVVPMVNTIIEQSAAHGGEQVICAMAHRGRLNVLAHVLEKPYETMLAEFAGTIPHEQNLQGDGDVKYHLGYANTRRVKPNEDGDYKQVKVSLLPNPSHLELINPIQQGIVRCKQQWLLDGNREKVVPICIHGDAAFCGQGIVFETLNLSELRGYRTGGTIHIIVNNQIGFTTPPKQGRFTPYPTDVAKSIQAPIFHVNGDDPEAVAHVARLAIAFRQQFKQDVFIDMWCYRKYGHNEQDEPGFTQPLMYKAIKDHVSARVKYEKQLEEDGTLTKAGAKDIKKEIVGRLKEAREAAKVEKPRGKVPSFSGVWNGFGRAPGELSDWDASTAIRPEVMETVISTLEQLPRGFTPHPKIAKLAEDRVAAIREDKGIDFGTGEMLAFGSLLLEGTNIRFTGQDVERGTFSHRHAVFHDYENGKRYRPLQHVGGGKRHENQGRFEIINTMLSEEAVLGFEWGFSSADPRNLVVWEAQFGDFVNGAQAIIDQILAAAESKWRYMNGLVMNLPHGYEGQGPEHSNGYLDRFLSLCAEQNMQVAVPSTPAQYFHLLRRQIHRRFRKPLILMMPKKLLRLEDAMSHVADFTEHGLQLVIDDPKVESPEQVRRVLLCTGKVYYTLDEARTQREQKDVAVVRVEELYPFHEAEIREAVARYGKATEIFWVQEEPKNRGAWGYMQPRLREMFPDRLVEYRGRDASASPAAGTKKMSDLEEQELVENSLTMSKKRVTSKA